MILFTLTTTVALYALTITIANVSLPQMQGSLSATQDQIAWVVTFNIVATAVATPMTGWATARFGQRPLLLGCVALFTLSSLLCGLAGSLETLVLFRICQGVFGAPLAPLSQAIVLATYPQRMHGTVTAVFGMGVVIGPIIAPTLGGYLSEEYGWRWVFYMIVPFGIGSLLGCWAFVTDAGRAARVRLDWTGFVALSIAIACLQLLLDRGERNSWFESTEIILEACAALVCLYIFLVHTFTTDRPFLNPRLFLDRNFILGIMLTLVFGLLNFTPMTLLPPLLQNLRGYPDTIIGLLLAARGAGTLLGFFFLFFGNKYDPRIWLVLGFSLQGIAGWQMAQFDINLTTWDVASAGFVQGLGVGFLWVPLTLVTFNTLSQDLFPEGSSIFHLLRNIGSSIHISISVALVLRSAKINYGHLAESLTPFEKSLQMPWVVGAWNTASAPGLAALSGEVQRQGLMIGYINAFYFYALTALAALPLILLVRMKKPEPVRPAPEVGRPAGQRR
ncbi:MAG: DHA2 family efflux MFS transporter permease subunit [Alphaproteobacteria bacterium]|jgi:DHA2 family multidrug resistance protein|nr:DHA2 family efflux MFS transporter permease subunit [Alphaproteobacteria bacterium]